MNRSRPLSVSSDVNRYRPAALPALPVVTVLAIVLVAGCSSAASPASPGSNGGPRTTQSTSAADFTITGYSFPELAAAPGQRITIADGDGEPHTVSADDGSFTSGTFDSTRPGTLVAPAAVGAYKVHCSVHPSMHGTLTVR
jgi:plastocyanin